MADRTVAVNLLLNPAGYTAGATQVQRANAAMTASTTATATRATAATGTMTAGMNRTGASMANVAGQAGLLRSGIATPMAAVGAAVVGTTKAAIDWESAWAGVTKTVDGTDAQLNTLQGDLRDMAKELPASHGEIAAVAEAAGQLGIKVDDVAAFSRVMIDLGETTNLSADQAATSIARLGNIMGTEQSEIENLGSALVDLGNNSETTEAEILTLAQRLAAAGNIAGLSESDVLAFAATLTSVGVNAEAGGTALSKVFTSVRDAVIDGSDALDVFARVAGTTAQDFAAQFEADPARAIASFIEGLGEMSARGESTTRVFEDLSLTDQRLMRALLSTAEAGDMLTDSIDLASDAFEENTALSEEAQRRYDTMAASLSVSWNKIKDAAISAGEETAPVLADLASGAAFVVDLLAQADDALDNLDFGGGGDVSFIDMVRSAVDPVQGLKNVTGLGKDLWSDLFGGAEEAADDAADSTDGFLTQLRDGAEAAIPDFVDALLLAEGGQTALGRATDDTADAQGRLQNRLDSTTDEVDAQQAMLDDLKDSLFAVANESLTLRDAQRDVEEAIDTAADTIARNGRTLDINTEAGRENQEAIDGIVLAAQREVQALIESGAATEDVTAATERAREAFIDAAEAAGLEKDEARELADQLGLIPEDVATKAELIDEASSEIERLKARIAEIERLINISVHVTRTETILPGQLAPRVHDGGMVTTTGIQKFHDGGEVTSTIPRFHQGTSRLASDEVPAILQVGEAVLSRAQVAMMERARYLELVAREMVRLGDVTDDEWEQLLALGWQGKAGDRMEALYPPLEGVRREFIKVGEVTKAEWQRLLRLGWQGDAGDRMEALYPPLDSLAVEAGKAAKLLRDANLSRIGVSGGSRTYDFFRSGGKSFAHIFGTGETLALGQMGEMQAGRFLRAMGKIPKAHDGASVVGTNEGLAVLKRGEEVLSAQMVSNLERAMAPVARPMAMASRGDSGDSSGGGHLTGNLYLETGEFMGVIRGEVRQGISEHDRTLKSRTRAGTGLAR